MIKKYICMLLLLTFSFTLTSCSDFSVKNASENTKQQAQKQSITATNAEVSDQTRSEKTKENIKTAVVYFSATGTTEEVAQLVAKMTDADIFEIIPETSYTREDLNYNNDNCRANREMNDNSVRPAISEDMSAVSNYDVVYLGYPIWWGTVPRIIQTFLESCDLSKATVYTFCTSGSSSIEQSISDLQELYPDINIVSGKRFNGTTESDVKYWLDSLE